MRIALAAAAIVYGSALSAAPAAQAGAICEGWGCGHNGLDPYGFAEGGASPNGDSSGGVTIVAVPADPTPPNPDSKRASDLGGVMVAAKPDPNPTPR
jgi:hypothetical protein